MSIYRGRNKNEVYLASLLYDAIEDHDLRSVKTLLSEKAADPNLVLPKKTISPFHLIVGNDSESFALEVSTLILQHGGDPNVQSDEGLTPVHIAAAWGRTQLLELFLSCGGDPEARDSNGNTPMYYASEQNYPECLNLLKTYLSDDVASILQRRDEKGDGSKKYDLVLDKIVVNNGATMGEYEVVNEYKARNSTIDTTSPALGLDDKKLQDLPQSDGNEVIMNWFNSLESIRKLSDSTFLDTTTNADTREEACTTDESLKESDEEVPIWKRMNDIRFRKVYTKKVRTPSKSPKTRNPSSDVINITSTTVNGGRHFTRESGIVSLHFTDSSLNNDNSNTSSLQFLITQRSSHIDIENSSNKSNNIAKETSSDYATCSLGSSSNFLNKTMFCGSVTANSVDDLSFVSVSEIYKYVDEDEGIVLYERRFLKTPSLNGSVTSIRSSILSTPVPDEVVDSEAIRKELTLLGYDPGPITITTRRIYLKKLKQLRRHPRCDQPQKNQVVYSPELEKTLSNPDCFKDLTPYKCLDDALIAQFSSPDPRKKWREGVIKSSFTYLLLDPRVTNNLPSRAELLSPLELWKTFLSSIFYVGKGKRSRPYSHLYDAVNMWNRGERGSDNKKLGRILDIWNDECGVICLHLFQNTIPVEAYTREGVLIAALRLENLCNAVRGNFYGIAATWTQKQKATLGVFLLYKAMMIFVNEGERQLCPSDID